MAKEDYQHDNTNEQPNGREERRSKKEKRKKKIVKDSSENDEVARFQEEPSSKDEASRESSEGKTENLESDPVRIEDSKSERKRKQPLKEALKAEKRGICYMSRIPPHMDPFKLQHILSQYGDIKRVYLTPENPAQARRKPGGRRQDQAYSEGWIEFCDKRIAKRVANMLNGEQIGGKKRSPFYYDLWNIKYLSKFKWDDLIGEIAYKSAVREQKLALENSAAKKERDFYLAKVDKARALDSIEERLKKKQKIQEESGTVADKPITLPPKIVRKFQQKKPFARKAAREAEPRLSRDLLAGVFGGAK